MFTFAPDFCYRFVLVTPPTNHDSSFQQDTHLRHFYRFLETHGTYITHRHLCKSTSRDSSWEMRKKKYKGKMRVSDRPTYLFFEFVTPPLSFVLFSSRNLSTKSNPSSPSATSRDVTENTRRAPLRECGRGWAVNLALFILIYTTSVLSSPWIRLPRVVCGLLNARICRFPSDVCVLFEES